MKADHEELPEVVFSSDQLIAELQRIARLQEDVLSLVDSALGAPESGRSWPILASWLEDRWTPEQGRFFEKSFPDGSAFRLLLKDGWLHVENTLPDGSKAYYEVNEQGSARECSLAYPISEYSVVIPPHIVLREELTSASVGDSARKVVLKWSLGHVVIHTLRGVLVGVDCKARCRVENSMRIIAVIAPPDEVNRA
jgi:hypothetical protein